MKPSHPESVRASVESGLRGLLGCPWIENPPESSRSFLLIEVEMGRVSLGGLSFVVLPGQQEDIRRHGQESES